GKASSLSLVSCMHNTSGCMSASHCSTRSRRAFNELTFQVAIRTGATVSNCRRADYADLARRRVALTGSCTSGTATASAATFLAARFFAGTGTTSTGAGGGGGSGAVFLARVLGVATAGDAAGWAGACFIARFFGVAGSAGAGSAGGGAAVAAAAAFLV